MGANFHFQIQYWEIRGSHNAYFYLWQPAGRLVRLLRSCCTVSTVTAAKVFQDSIRVQDACRQQVSSEHEQTMCLLLDWVDVVQLTA